MRHKTIAIATGWVGCNVKYYRPDQQCLSHSRYCSTLLLGQQTTNHQNQIGVLLCRKCNPFTVYLYWNTSCFCAYTMSRMWRVRLNLTVTVHELDDVYENRRSIWMTVAANRRRFRRRIHAGGILHGRNYMLRRREIVFRACCETKWQVERSNAEETTYLWRFCR